MSGRPAKPAGAKSRAPADSGARRPAETPAADPFPRNRGPAIIDLALMLAAFALCSAIAGLAGAPNLGTALTFGQIGFVLAAVYVLLWR